MLDRNTGVWRWQQAENVGQKWVPTRLSVDSTKIGKFVFHLAVSDGNKHPQSATVVILNLQTSGRGVLIMVFLYISALNLLSKSALKHSLVAAAMDGKVKARVSPRARSDGWVSAFHWSLLAGQTPRRKYEVSGHNCGP